LDQVNCPTTARRRQCVCQYANPVHTMRTNIVIDDKLMDEALRLTGLKTKREVVELGLQTIVRLRTQDEIRRFRGKLDWQGDFDAMRSDK
jgi:Arc/MetJ family transcription regulator